MDGRVSLDERIKSGETSTVFRGTNGGVDVAVKVLHPHLASDPIVRARFSREGEMLAEIRHPNIVRVFDAVEIDGRPALIMELLTGGDLRGVIMKPTEAARLLEALARALAEIHRRGIVHRDLRPEHVILGADESPRIVDFGMASVKDLSGLTRSTVYAARPGYVDPYTWGRGRSLPTQDLYSLGAIIHTVITGRPPSGSAFAKPSERGGEDRLADLKEKAGTPLGEIVAALLDIPERRPRSAQEVLDWLQSRQLPAIRDLSECLHCGKPMPNQAPLCLSCGRPPLHIRLDSQGESLVLRKITEKQEVLGPFLSRLRILSDGPLPHIKLIIGDARLYSRAEQKAGIRIPVRIADGIHSSSVETLVQVLSGSAGSDIRITRYPMSRRGRYKRGPLVSLREGRVLPDATQAALRRLVDRGREKSGGLRNQCRYAVSLAAASLGEDPLTEHLADETHLSSLWKKLDGAALALENTFKHLAGTNLQSVYADLERLDMKSVSGGRQSKREKEKERLAALFANHAETERAAAKLEQRIVQACRILENLEPSRAPEQLHEVEQLLTE